MKNQVLTIKDAKEQITENVIKICKYQRLDIYLGKLIGNMYEDIYSDLMIKDVEERLICLLSSFIAASIILISPQFLIVS